MRRYLVIGIDHDDADTWSMEVTAESPLMARELARDKYLEDHSAEFSAVETKYAFLWDGLQGWNAAGRPITPFTEGV